VAAAAAAASAASEVSGLLRVLSVAWLTVDINIKSSAARCSIAAGIAALAQINQRPSNRKGVFDH
jgi:hypothetical protein